MIAWTNLGMMYLMHDDNELAAQAFSRGQAIDPENAATWVGQAVLASRARDHGEAHELYQHAFEIGDRSFVSSLRDDLILSGFCKLSICPKCLS